MNLILDSCTEVCHIIAKYEKREKYLPILQEATWDNCFIVKCLLKSHVARVILLTSWLYRAWVIQFNANLVEGKTASTNVTWLYFYLYNSIRIFCTLFLFYVLDGLLHSICFQMFCLFQTFDYFWKDLPTMFLIYCVYCISLHSCLLSFYQNAKLIIEKQSYHSKEASTSLELRKGLF